MNIYEQLVSVRTQLKVRGVRPRTLAVVDQLIEQAEGSKNEAMSVSQMMVLRYVMRYPPVLNDEDIYLEILDFQGDLEEAHKTADEPDAAYVDSDRRPKLHSHYKKEAKR
jgi:hypothetical protein